MDASVPGRYLIRAIVLGALLASTPGSAAANTEKAAKTPIRVLAEEVIDDLFESLSKKPAPVSRDLRFRNGLVGIGAYRPAGTFVGGIEAPPIHISPSARAGGSLNVDPVTGRSFFTWPYRTPPARPAAATRTTPASSPTSCARC